MIPCHSLRSGLSVLALLLAFGLEASAQTVTTVPVGAVTVSFPQGTSCGSLTLEEASVYVGAVSAAGANSLTVASVGSWVSGAYAVPAAPYAVRITSGVLSGSTFKITANTDVSLTLDTKGINISSLLAASDKFRIFPVDTLGTLFGTSSVDFQTGGSASAADNILLWSGTAWLTYYHNGTSWRRSGSLSNQNDAVLMPDDGFMVIRRPASTLSLVLTGCVRDGAAKLLVKGSASTFAANSFPVNQTLASLPFSTMSGWLKAASASASDNVMVWSGSTWLTFYHNGTSWRRSGSLSNQDAYSIPAGSPYFVRRISSPALDVSYASFNLPYAL